ncbi:hypothetical protein SAMN05443144_11080 [Fodinibius roseus]|uniref:Uncharacterized protein n=1 Tax=Fodinibius roseus TaxID=1194090 RepID=A0A1M5CT09_9BACT|nr:hypothetical protein SAMN05443144_11080 [Fodinibius roseus]
MDGKNKHTGTVISRGYLLQARHGTGNNMIIIAFPGKLNCISK